MTVTTTNPATGKKLKEYKRLTKKQVAKKIDKAHKTWLKWRKTDFDHRSKLMHKAAEVLEKNKKKYAKLMVREMGKTITEAEGEIEKCAWVCRYYADNAADFLAKEIIETDAEKSYVTFQPIGAVLAVMPWNYPFWQVFRFAAPGLMAGNVGLLKHASNVIGCGDAIQEVFEKAGFPKGAFLHLNMSADDIADILKNDKIKAATLTGSDPAGRSVAENAGKNIKKTVLELGGSDAYLILEDADPEEAAEICKNGRLLNAGQSCIGAKRFIVTEKVYDKFLKAFKKKMKNAKQGDPMNRDTKYATMAREDLREELHEQVKKSVKKGAKIEIGGKIPKGKGAFYPATILTNVKPGMPAYEEEFFGPVASVIKVKDEKEAIKVANESKFGLGGAVITKDKKRGEKIAAEMLEAGCCFVNAFVKSDPRLPFGGIKTSGYGRELSHYGIKEFVNIKTVYVAE